MKADRQPHGPRSRKVAGFLFYVRINKMDWSTVSQFVHRHQEGLELFGMASIVTMRKTLPWPFCLVPPLEWGYEWLRDALMTLLSLKGPIAHGPELQSSERVTKAADGSVESVKESTVKAGDLPDSKAAPVASEEKA